MESWGNITQENGYERFYYVEKHGDFVIEISGRCYPNTDIENDIESIIRDVRLGVKSRPTAGLPHPGYAFNWVDAYPLWRSMEDKSIRSRLLVWIKANSKG